MWTRLEARFDLLWFRLMCFGLVLICVLSVVLLLRCLSSFSCVLSVLSVVLLLQERSLLANCWAAVRAMRAVRYHFFPFLFAVLNIHKRNLKPYTQNPKHSVICRVHIAPSLAVLPIHIVRTFEHPILNPIYIYILCIFRCVEYTAHLSLSRLCLGIYLTLSPYLS